MLPLPSRFAVVMLERDDFGLNRDGDSPTRG